MTAQAGDALVRKLVVFGRILREAGVEVGPGRLQAGLIALDSVDLRSRDEVYYALACTLVAKRDDLEIFDLAFRAWFERAPTKRGGQSPLDLGIEQKRETPTLLPAHAMGEEEVDEEGEDGEDPDSIAAYSSEELLRQKDFAAMSTAELRQIRSVCERLVRSLPKRASRRLEPSATGAHLDPRTMLRLAMRHEGEPVARAFRDPKLVERRIVFLCDISGSMEPYARPMVMFLQAAVAAGRRIEAFTFGTRLTRLTPFLDGRDPERALERAGRAVPDWAGGTRIGESFKAFNSVYGRRGLTRGAIIVIASDGWERGDCTLLGLEMQTFHRRSRAVVWVNPLKGAAEYRPIAGGMAAALPHIDVFLPGHNLAALETLAGVLEKLGRQSTILRGAA